MDDTAGISEATEGSASTSERVTRQNRRRIFCGVLTHYQPHWNVVIDYQIMAPKVYQRQLKL
jgi:hypothetical protein